MKNKPTAVVWDLDSTVCDTQHRHHLTPRLHPGDREYTWERYSLACENDIPIAGSVALMHLLWPHYQQIAISGRSECAWDATVRWLARHNVPLDRVILRDDGDHTPNGEFKVRWLEKLSAEGIVLAVFMEDWPEAGRFIGEHTGIPVSLVNPGYDGTCTCGHADALPSGSSPGVREGG